MEKFAKAMLPVAAGVILAGLILHFGKDLPGVAEARLGFDN